jgi:pyruvate dehydrogenase E1 component
MNDDAGRSGVLVRAVTRGAPQKELMPRLRKHRRFKAGIEAGVALAAAEDLPGSYEGEIEALPDADILAHVREDCLAGAYYLIDWRGYGDYRPGDNVVHVFALGSPATESIVACDALLAEGIYANLVIVSSPELLVGILGDKDGYSHLLEGLGIDGALHVWPDPRDARAADLLTYAGGRVPIVAVCDGEAGLLDNIGSIVGVRQETLAVRKFSKCGTPAAIYGYQHLDAGAIQEAARQILAATACERLLVHPAAPAELERAHARATPPAVDV